MPELGLSSTYDYSTATSNRKKSIFLVIGVNRDTVSADTATATKRGISGTAADSRRRATIRKEVN